MIGSEITSKNKKNTFIYITKIQFFKKKKDNQFDFFLIFYIFLMKHDRQSIRHVFDDFSSKFLRMSVVEDDKLQLNLGYHWKQNNKQDSHQTQRDENVSSNRLHSERDTQYFNLAMLFFSQMANEAALDIDLLDTLFFHQDHNICYIYKDARKGLVRMKLRGITACENFLKRKLKKREVMSSKQRIARKYKPLATASNQERSEKSIKEEMGYIALLKYKDGTFLRLRESDLRSIFTNPLYANEKFRHHNCTQYIQSLPQEGTDEFRIHFLPKFREHPLFQIATKYQLGGCEFGERASLRRQMLNLDPLVFLYFTVFEICSFVCIHYNRRIDSGTFHFVREAEGWSLAGIEGARMVQLDQKQFIRASLWDENRKVTFGEFKQNEKEIFKLKEEVKSPFYQKVEAHFEQTNAAIRTDMLSFVQQKISNIKRTSDKLLSRTIFNILHPQRPATNLYDLLDSPHHLANLMSPSHKKFVKMAQQKEEPVAKKARQKQSRKQVNSKFVYRGIESCRAQFSEFHE